MNLTDPFSSPAKPVGAALTSGSEPGRVDRLIKLIELARQAVNEELAIVGIRTVLALDTSFSDAFCLRFSCAGENAPRNGRIARIVVDGDGLAARLGDASCSVIKLGVAAAADHEAMIDFIFSIIEALANE